MSICMILFIFDFKIFIKFFFFFFIVKVEASPQTDTHAHAHTRWWSVDSLVCLVGWFDLERFTTYVEIFFCLSIDRVNKESNHCNCVGLQIKFHLITEWFQKTKTICILNYKHTYIIGHYQPFDLEQQISLRNFSCPLYLLSQNFAPEICWQEVAQEYFLCFCIAI